MRREEIEELIRLVEESKISELEICEGKRRIRISKNARARASGHSEAPVSADENSEADGDLIQTNSEGSEKLASNLKQITSPMVGTFYRSPAPDSDPFVETGQIVEVGQTVCIVEAMKVMNEIGSDYSGKIRKVLVENAQPVEYGQPLFLIDTE